mmetsp:Transcript_33875/g.66659  ORF Transcript_33875/g.66659 Transcript_33875/m.66659 type:complete len:174 (-) Transcript_33875:162-683(-)
MNGEMKFLGRLLMTSRDSPSTQLNPPSFPPLLPTPLPASSSASSSSSSPSSSPSQPSLASNDYEISLTCRTQIRPLAGKGESENILRHAFAFVQVAELRNLAPGCVADVCGVLLHASNTRRIVSSRSQKEISKKVLTIADNSMHSVQISVWGDTAERLFASSSSSSSCWELKS